MKVGAVIIARYNSSRLYGKVLKPLHGIPAIEHTYNRLSQVLHPSRIILATSEEPTDDPIAEFALIKNWNCFRGSLENVAERFLRAGESQGWDYLIRTNGDNIFIDLECMSEMIGLAEQGKYDFLSNVKDRTYPKGMSVEIVRRDFYARHLEVINKNADYREHVTLALYENNWGKTEYFYNTWVSDIQGIQLALDTPEDFKRIDRMISIMEQTYFDYTLQDIKEAYEQLDR
ncbi:hypothetical protein N9355_01125 [Crocinitomicaceae bacterium]|nr:hypothetical protein [Crocinitomicaceae bacterium]